MEITKKGEKKKYSFIKKKKKDMPPTTKETDQLHPNNVLCTPMYTKQFFFINFQNPNT